LKNLLIFLPLLVGHAYTDMGLLLAAIGAFIAFGLCASGVYLFNDLLDLPSDRAHPRKRRRAFASGKLPIKHGALLAPLLLVSGFGIAALLPWMFAVVLAGYVVITFAYSLWLKTKVMVDVMVLAGLYTIRILAGCAATTIAPSFWLLAFSMFLFLSLAMIKRYTELLALRHANKNATAGRGYEIADLATTQSLGGASGYLSVLVLALYINSDAVQVHYHRPEALWLLCPLVLYWVSRMWQRAGRGKMHDDPLIFAIEDPVSRWVMLACGVILGFATWL
jgi:4-hydroxybenzoate polyprenyltransferase